MTKNTLNVNGATVAMFRLEDADYVSLTDIAKHGNENRAADTISAWLRNSSTLRYLQTWESVHNSIFKVDQMIDFRMMAQNQRMAVTPKRFIEVTGAVGLIAKPGRYGGTWAHSDIALEFCTWMSPEFKVYFFKEFQRLKREEATRDSLEWHVERVTDLLDEARNWMDTIPGQKPVRNRIGPSHDH